MKITKRQLKRIIKEEKAKLQEAQMTEGDQDQMVYDEVYERAVSLAEEFLNAYGPEDDVIEAIVNALSDSAQTILTDASVMR